MRLQEALSLGGAHVRLQEALSLGGAYGSPRGAVLIRGAGYATKAGNEAEAAGALSDLGGVSGFHAPAAGDEEGADESVEAAFHTALEEAASLMPEDQMDDALAACRLHR